MQIDKRELQFELWRECNLRCTYCYNGLHNKKTPIEEKIKNLKTIYSMVSDLSNYTDKKINVISFIGGEFFQGQLNDDNVKALFFKLIDKINFLLSNGYIKEFWLCATLVTGDQIDLYKTLDLIQDKSKIWICTSYDTVGRFHTDALYENWKKHIINIITLYPSIKINITSILTGDFIDKYINNSLEVLNIIRRYKNNISVFLKPPEPMLITEYDFCSKQEMNDKIPNFFPTRQNFLKFLYCFKSREEQSLYNSIFNMNLRCDFFYKFLDGNVNRVAQRLKDTYQEKINDDTPILSCGHSNEYTMYIDSEDCCICDKIMIDNI